MQKTLVIVDMQKWFLSEKDYDKLPIRMIKKVRKAISRKEPIVLLEWVEGGSHCDPLSIENSKTHPSILKVLKNKRAKVYFGIKDDMSGGPQVSAIVKQHGLPTTFEVIGVNTHQCVMATAVNLKKRQYNVFVNERYCGCACCKDDKESIFLTDELLVSRGIPVVSKQLQKLKAIVTNQ